MNNFRPSDNDMWKQIVKDYLQFTRKDRVGIFVLVALIFIVVLLPYLLPSRKLRTPDQHELDKIKTLAAQLNSKDSQLNRYPREEYSTMHANAASKPFSIHYELFFFDPNTLDEAGWKKLGIRDKTIGTIMKYLSKGGKFRQPEDLGKIYGLFTNDFERLLPYVRIGNRAMEEKRYEVVKSDSGSGRKQYYTEKRSVGPSAIDINSADTSALIALPGIGSKLALRIISFREKLGGFYSVEQIGETYGLPDSTFSKIKPVLQCNKVSVQKININTADANTLKQHPYIRWNIANAIIQYRTQHDHFKSVEELQQLAVVTPEIFQKIKPYLITE